MSNKRRQRQRVRKNLRKLLKKEPPESEINSEKNNCETAGDSTDQIESSFQPTEEQPNSPQAHPLPLKCLICAREITSGISGSTDTVSRDTLLCQLFKLLKISPAVALSALQNSVEPVLYCQPCVKTISNGTQMLKQIEYLQNSLESLTNKIKEDFMEDYHRRSDINENSSIRKTLVQCWTTCQVRIEKLSASSYIKQEDVLFKVESKVEGVMPVKVEESNEGLMDVHGSVSFNDFDFDETPCADAGSKSDCLLPADNFDDKDDGLRSSPASPPPANDAPEVTGVIFGPQILEAQVQKLDGAESAVASTVQTNEEPINTDLKIENNNNLTPRRSLRLRPKVKIPTYCVENDENVSERGSVYHPDSSPEIEEIEVLEIKRSKGRKRPSSRSLSEKLKKRQRMKIKTQPNTHDEVADSDSKVDFPFMCAACGKSYKTKQTLNVHQNGYCRKLNYSCPRCDKTFSTKEKLDIHYSSDHPSEAQEDISSYSYSCFACKITYNVKYEQTSTGGKVLPCVFDNCKVVNKSPLGHLKHHEKHHEKARIFRCKFCDKEFSRDHDYFLTKLGERKFKCSFDDKCKKVFDKFQALWGHHRHHHNYVPGNPPLEKFDPERHTCKYCQRVFRKAWSCRTHEITVHTKQFKYFCEICGLGRPSMPKLKQHYAAHTGERPYKCDKCPKSFKKITDLKFHLNKHNDYRPYQCEICGKAYHNGNTLYIHQKMHERKIAIEKMKSESAKKGK